MVVAGSILTLPDIAVGPIIGVGVGVAIIVPIVFHPFSKTIWCAIDLGFDPLAPGEAPGLENIGSDDLGTMESSREQ